MTFYAKYIKRWTFLIHLAVLAALLVVLLLNNNDFFTWSTHWKSLPPLPGGETARVFTDVLPRNRINVVTDQGHYFSCRYEAEETCWVAIPREVNTPQSKSPVKSRPRAPQGTRQMVYTYGPIYDETYLLSAAILKDGQVAISTGRIGAFDDLLRLLCNGCCGLMFLVAVGELAYVLRHRWDDDPVG